MPCRGSERIPLEVFPHLKSIPYGKQDRQQDERERESEFALPSRYVLENELLPTVANNRWKPDCSAAQIARLFRKVQPVCVC